MTSKPEDKLWGGRFVDPPAEELVAISRSVHFDWRLAPYDLVQTMSHAQALLDSEVLTASEFSMLKTAILNLAHEIDSGEANFNENDEDVHTAIERLITEKLPEIGPKIRAGRSRNDQVATDLRLYVRDQNQQIVQLLVNLVKEICQKANIYYDQPAPGFTHLQHAQPVTLGHELAKHAHALMRDMSRSLEIDKRIATSPLGSGALSGSSFTSDPNKLAKLLGFNHAATNSIDAVSDRDFVVEFLFNLALISVHLSRIAEEIILYTSPEFDYAKLHDSWSTGSSLMPQKKNPDIAELTRGKTGRFIGNLTSILITLKALPFAYNRDLQEDKEVLFDSVDQMKLILPALTGLLSTLTFDTEKLKQSTKYGHLSATDLADYLVKQGVAFRKAHEVVGNLVQLAENSGVDVGELSIEQLQSVSTFFQPDVLEMRKIENMLQVRNSTLGTAPLSVKRQIENLLTELDTIDKWANDPLVHKFQ